MISVWLSNLMEESYFRDLSNPHLQLPDQMLWGRMCGFIGFCLIKELQFLLSNCNDNYKVTHDDMLHNKTYLNVI